jgi:hypothetical protein
MPFGSSDQNMSRNSPTSMDFNPFDGRWDDETPAKTTSTSGMWHFVQFDSTSALPPPPSSSNLPKLRLKLPITNRNCFRVGDDEKETRSPLSSLSNNVKSFKSVKVQEAKKKVKGKLRNILSPRVSKHTSFSITPVLSTSATEPLSDDEDSLWNEMPSQRGLFERDHLSIKYSKRSEISDGSETKPASESEIAQRVLRPNSTHVNASFWSERNLRPYMEDRILLDRVGSTFAPFSSEVKGKLSIPALIDKLDRVGRNIKGSPVNADSLPFPQEAISLYGVFDGHAGSLASQFCSDWMTSYLYENPFFPTDIPKALS